jgi:hypothetical protein
MAMLLGGASMHAAAKARRQFAMPCGFARIATMGDGDARCSMAVHCPQKYADRRREPLYGSERVARKALTGQEQALANDRSRHRTEPTM